MSKFLEKLLSPNGEISSRRVAGLSILMIAMTFYAIAFVMTIFFDYEIKGSLYENLNILIGISSGLLGATGLTDKLKGK